MNRNLFLHRVQCLGSCICATKQLLKVDFAHQLWNQRQSTSTTLEWCVAGTCAQNNLKSVTSEYPTEDPIQQLDLTV
jgi:hypothetical protein